MKLVYSTGQMEDELGVWETSLSTRKTVTTSNTPGICSTLKSFSYKPISKRFPNRKTNARAKPCRTKM